MTPSCRFMFHTNSHTISQVYFHALSLFPFLAFMFHVQCTASFITSRCLVVPCHIPAVAPFSSFRSMPHLQLLSNIPAVISYPTPSCCPISELSFPIPSCPSSQLLFHAPSPAVVPCISSRSSPTKLLSHFAGMAPSPILNYCPTY
jgi:hypothetical protein